MSLLSMESQPLQITDPRINESREAPISMTYGHFGTGKTYVSTSEALSLLRQGHSVKTTWPIRFDGFDQRNSFKHRLFGLLGKKKFFKFDAKNHEFIPLSDPDFEKKFIASTDCHWFIDEGHLFLNAYVGKNISLAKMSSILSMRHFSRYVHIITPRPTNVAASFRGNVDIFYRMKKVWWLSWAWPVFIKQRFDEMKDDTVDEEKAPVSTQWYIGHPAVFGAYNSKYMRFGLERSQPVYGEEFLVPYHRRILMFFDSILLRIPSRLGRGFSPPRAPAVVPLISSSTKKKRDWRSLQVGRGS